jgi:hypothetical protein
MLKRMKFSKEDNPDLANAKRAAEDAKDTKPPGSRRTCWRIVKYVLGGGTIATVIAGVTYLILLIMGWFKQIGYCKVYNPNGPGGHPISTTVSCPKAPKATLAQECICTSPKTGPCGSATGVGCHALNAACEPPFNPPSMLCSAGYEYAFYTQSPADGANNALQSAINSILTVFEIIAEAILWTLAGLVIIAVLYIMYKVLIRPFVIPYFKRMFRRTGAQENLAKQD